MVNVVRRAGGHRCGPPLLGRSNFKASVSLAMVKWWTLGVTWSVSYAAIGALCFSISRGPPTGSSSRLSISRSSAPSLISPRCSLRRLLSLWRRLVVLGRRLLGQM
eukprot:7502603-Pyramimonas_sp.AAC.1